MHQRQTSFIHEIHYIPQRANLYLKLELRADLSKLENERPLHCLEMPGTSYSVMPLNP